MSTDAGGVSASNAELGPLPEPAYPDCYEIPRTGGATCSGYSAEQMEQYADAAVAAERERCAAIARRWGETHADGVTVNARNAASKIARGIEGHNVRANRATPARSNDD